MMGTPLQQEDETLNPGSVCRLIEDGKNLKTYDLDSTLLSKKTKCCESYMHVGLPVLLKRDAQCIKVSIDTTDNAYLRLLYFQESPFSHLKVSDQLDLYMDKLFQFFHNVENSLSSNYLPPELQLNCCSNETSPKGCELERESIINSFVIKMLKLNRSDIIKLILQ